MLDEAIQIKDVNAHTRLIENFKFLNISKFKSGWCCFFSTKIKNIAKTIDMPIEAIMYGFNCSVCCDKINEPKNNSVTINCKIAPTISIHSSFLSPLGKNLSPNINTPIPNGTLM